MNNITMNLSSPLFTGWSPQYIRLRLAGVEPGAPLALAVDGVSLPFQYTGTSSETGSEILVKLGFTKGETRELVFSEADASGTDLTACAIPFDAPVMIGTEGRVLMVSSTSPFLGFAGFPMQSQIRCDHPLLRSLLALVCDGPLFADYRLVYDYGENRAYTLRFRCYKEDPYIEVEERFSLRMRAGLVWTINPEKNLTHIISRDSFEGDSQPTVEPLGAEHPRDLLCRLQMPVQTEYFIPNNRGWFAFCDERDESRGMIGILGLYGAKWEEPVANMPELLDKGGTVEWNASLESGVRHWLLYAGPVEKGYSKEEIAPIGQIRPISPADPRFIFHRLHAEFNALRLDEHLDLTGDAALDASCAALPGVFAAGDFHAAARNRLGQYPCLQGVLDDPDDWLKQSGAMHLASYRYLLEPTPENARSLYGFLIERFERWVRQFQGYRANQPDYMKNVIGFSRYLRGMLLAYEQLRRDAALSEEEFRKLGAYFAFAARRILDEGRWPHSRTWKHPDHPESSRDFYTYGGEHKPDRLIWTNSLPNFQSDPLCALAHLSAVFKDHPDAAFWRRFGLDEIDRQLDAYCGKSGAWQESINYALYTLSYFVITFKVVKERWGIDYFNDERVRRFVSWLCRFVGPVDKRFGVHTMPGIGNAVLPQTGADTMLCFAAELAEDDPLRASCLALWKMGETYARPGEHYPVVMAAMAPFGISLHPSSFILHPLQSECMDEVGVALRDRQGEPDESYLFQKIGFAKDHYEADETAFNWYAKGTPLCMDYGTYTGDVGVGGAHNLVEIPDEDPLRRGYLGDHLFTPALDYTRCEVPVTLKLLWGKVRSFAEVENKDGKIDRTKTPYFYIGDKNPVGPKVWKVRQLLFVKPDYTVIFDRVYGQVPHRYNLHFTGTDIRREDSKITAEGRFDLDLLAYVQHPAQFEMETGELIPNVHSAGGGEEARAKHAQHYFRLYNHTDGIYRTLLFARERGREIRIESFGASGMKVVTPEYTDHVWLHNDMVDESIDGVRFVGRAGWIRRAADGAVTACVPDGELIEAFGSRFEGRGPWSAGKDGVVIHRGAPRTVQINPARHS
jgi:hypothetical protein